MEASKVSYLAGIVDGEGSISLNCLRRKNGMCNFRPYISITNTHKGLLQFCSDLLEEITQRPCPIQLIDQRGKRPIFRVRVQHRQGVINVLNILCPVLIAKQEQAKIVMEFLRCKPYRGSWSEEQAVLHSKIVRLNKTGISSNS